MQIRWRFKAHLGWVDTNKNNYIPNIINNILFIEDI